MLVLKSLEIQGFKSFPDKTKIQFGRGLTAVVGPNGSGKSNISDSVRWVMGEQSSKNLRGAKMEDVIFTGTKSRRSQGFAEVSLVIDNSDKTLPIEEDEVIITRKYYRSGESEYSINRVSVRLKDIHELFMDTGLGKDGYALVGQGRIAEIVQSKSDERRQIFEEAAGIAKYRYRKNEAEKKLHFAEENLVRLKDILQELEGRVTPLKQQAQKAKQFLELAQRQKTLEISIWIDTLNQSNLSLKNQTDIILKKDMQRQQLEEEIDDLEVQIQTIYSKMQQYLIDIDHLRKQKDESEKQSANLQSIIAVYENDIQHNQENQHRIYQEIQNSQQTEQQLLQTIQQNQTLYQQSTQQLDTLIQEIDNLEKNLATLSQKNEAIANEYTQLNQEINHLLMQQSETKLRLVQLTAQNQEESERFVNNQQVLKQKDEDIRLYQEELTSVEETYQQLEQRQSSLSNMIAGYEKKLDHQRQLQKQQEKTLYQIQTDQLKKQQQAKLLMDLEQHMEGFAHSVKAVLTAQKRGILKGILGTISQLIEVSEVYSSAVEAALGGSLQHIVTEDEQAAKSAIYHLKREHAGRATFLPMTSIRGNRLDTVQITSSEGFCALACDVVSYQPEYEDIVLSLLGKIVIVSDLDCAILMAKQQKHRFKIVTLDGQILHAGGSMSGGSKNKTQGFLSRKAEIALLEKQVLECTKQQQYQQKQLDETHEQMAQFRQQITRISREMSTVNEDRIRCEGEQKRLTQLIEQEGRLLIQMKQELHDYQKKLDSRQNQSVDLKEQIETIEEQLSQKRTKLSFIQTSQEQHQKQYQQLFDELSEVRYQKLELQKDAEVLQNRILELQNRGTASKEQLLCLHQTQTDLEQQQIQIQEKISTSREKIDAIKENSIFIEQQVEKRVAQRNSLESEATLLRQKERQVSIEKERVVQELARVQERKQAIQRDYDNIINELWQEYQLTRGEAQRIAIELEDIGRSNQELRSLKTKIKNLGNVNVGAIEEYKEISERYTFLNRQLSDIEHSKSELTRMIQDLTKKMQEIFSENFKLINAHFQAIFVELFGGGRAELRLTEPEQILSCGIEIFVEPPGKIIKNLSLLSGGEQAFVAIAIYFAILKVRPAPFCILDEIEAALDDVNVTKYAKYLRLISDKTQFIMITHRRGTMEEADVLYGVTMQEEGVSKLLQLKVSEVERELGNQMQLD